MILKDIADRIKWMFLQFLGWQIANTYLPYGTKLIKEFFSESMKNIQGEDVSTREIKNILESVIDEEVKKNRSPTKNCLCS